MVLPYIRKSVANFIIAVYKTIRIVLLIDKYEKIFSKCKNSINAIFLGSRITVKQHYYTYTDNFVTFSDSIF